MENARKGKSEGKTVRIPMPDLVKQIVSLLEQNATQKNAAAMAAYMKTQLSVLQALRPIWGVHWWPLCTIV